MLYFILPIVRQNDPLVGYLAQWGQSVANRVQIVDYHGTVAIGGFRGACVFLVGVQRGGPIEAETRQLSDFIATRAPGLRQLNRPGAPLARADLLRRLHDTGFNAYNVFRLDEIDSIARYPVYLRADDKQGEMSGLLADRRQLDDAIEAALADGRDRDRLLITEFLETSRDGIYRKYSALNIGGRIIAHHIFFSRNWIVRAENLLPFTREMIAEEAEFQQSNPHLDAVAEAFSIAQIDFGRIDYAVDNGRVQVWEINTNPVLLQPKSYYAPMQMPNKVWFANALNEELRKLSRSRPADPLATGDTAAMQPASLH